ncbi:hypothetical protein [Arsenophonus sp. PmNCSU2021_1]|uniref:hypothetical protein n=1 Tax=Arsenophonus sp. PmNCSU2021_1 TaxID=3118989 RepID=UPI002FF3CAAC
MWFYHNFELKREHFNLYKLFEVTMKITIVRDLVEFIEFLGVDLAFGVSGGFVMPIWQELTRSKK